MTAGPGQGRGTFSGTGLCGFDSGDMMKKELTLFDKPKNVKILLICFYCSLGVLLAAEFFIHPHPAFYFEQIKGFSAVYGFFSCVLLIFLAKLLRLIVMKKEDYYDR